MSVRNSIEITYVLHIGGYLMSKILTKRNITFGLLLVAFIIIFEILLARLNLPAWPAFMVMIFFFVAHEDIKQAPPIIIGGLMGILCVMLLAGFIDLLRPFMEHEAAKLFFIGLFVFAIVLLQNVLPYFFNSYAFMFFLVSAIAKQVPHANPYVWMGVELVVGGIFILGILGIGRLVAAMIKD